MPFPRSKEQRLEMLVLLSVMQRNGERSDPHCSVSPNSGACVRPTTADCRAEMRRSRHRSAWPTTADHQLEKRQRFDPFVESVPYQKLSSPVSPPFHSPKSHWFSVRAGATETDRGNSNAIESLVGLKRARDGTQSYGCLARECEERKGVVIDGKHFSARGAVFVRHAILKRRWHQARRTAGR